MSTFEFTITLFSIVLAIAIARILGGVADLIKYRAVLERIPFYTLWLIYLSLIPVGWWFFVWSLRDIEIITLPQFFSLFIVPVTIFISSRLLIPEDADFADIEANFDRVRIPFLLILSCSILVPAGLLSIQQGDFVLARLVLVPVGLVILSGVFFSHIVYQYIVVSLANIGYLYFLFTFRYSIGG